MKHAFYSTQMAELTGTVVYARADGTEVEVTCVSDNPEASGVYWNDLQYLGEVERYVRGGLKAPLFEFEPEQTMSGRWPRHYLSMIDVPVHRPHKIMADDIT